MFLVAANTRQAIVGQKEWLTTGSSGIQVQFLFSDDWDGLSKFAVFRNAEIEESVIPIALPSSNLTELPAENCAAEYVDEKVYVGVYGSDGLGHIIIPTIWVSLGVLKEGAAYEGMDPPQPTQDMWAQILAIAQNAGAENAAAAEAAAGRAEEAAELLTDVSATATTLEPEKQATANYNNGVFEFGIPKGQKGDPLTYEDLTEEQKEELVQGPILDAQDAAVTAVGNARVTAVNAVNQAGTTQVGNVNQAGTTQVQAVADKGAEVIGSIPPDYSDLADEVDDLNRHLSELKNTVGGQFEQIYSYDRPAGDTGTNWNNEANIDIPQGTSFYVVCNSYSGTKFSKLRLWGYTTSNSWVELASTTGIGVAINVVASTAYTRLRFMLVQSSLEAPCSATYTVWEDATGLVSNVESIELDVNALEETTFELNTDEPYNLIPTDMVWVAHSYINNSDGATVNVTDTSSEYYPCYSSDYIPIDSSKGYICNYITVPRELYDEENDTHISQVAVPFNRFMYAFYTGEKVFVATSSANSATSKAIPQTAKYIKVTVVNSDMIPFARLIYGNYVDRPNLRVVEYKETLPKNYYKAPTGYEDFKMVLFGDSITAGPASGFCIADYASDYLNSNVISVGFGGTRMTYDLVGAGLFCFYHLCECIVSNDPTIWNPLDSYIETMESTIKPNYQAHLATLKAMDWSQVNAIGILYGANDYSSNTPVGTSYNEVLTNYDGACAYGIKLLLQKYPHLQVLLFKPFFGLTTMGDYDTGMDVVANTTGLYIQDYGEALLNVQDGLHVPVVNTMQELGINKYTLKYYSDDGLHPRTQQALQRLGHQWANIIKRYISPF